jgi:hypothetical protein
LVGSAIPKVQVDWNAESDPILEKDLDLECDPKKSDWSEACAFAARPLHKPLLSTITTQSGA